MAMEAGAAIAAAATPIPVRRPTVPPPPVPLYPSLPNGDVVGPIFGTPPLHPRDEGDEEEVFYDW